MNYFKKATHDILGEVRKMTKHINQGVIFPATNKIIFNNNEPVNILHVIRVAEFVQNFVKPSEQQFKLFLGDMSKISGYSIDEIKERL